MSRARAASAPRRSGASTAYALSLAQQYLPAGGAPAPFPAPPAAAGALAAAAPLALARRLFLPRGELPPDYAPFQLLDSLQALCSYLRGGIAMHATLTGLGLGRESASALSATLALMLKEGAAHVASLGFALAVASRLDGEVRFWRLAADVANDIGLALELAAPLLPRLFLPLTCAANAFKAVCGVAAGATRVAISAHFASGRSGALVAEVAAKEGTQETAVTLAGLALGMLLAPLLNASASAQWASFALLTLVHVAANAAAVRCLALRTLSRTRALLLLQAAAAAAPGSACPTPRALRQREPLLPVQYAQLLPWGGAGGGGEGGRVSLGCSLEALRQGAGGGSEWQGRVRLGSGSGSGGGVALSEALRSASAARGADFFLLAHAPGRAWVAYAAEASPRTMLRGWLAALAALGRFPAADAGRLLAQWEAAGWDLSVSGLEEEGWRVSLVGVPPGGA